MTHCDARLLFVSSSRSLRDRRHDTARCGKR